MAERVLPQSEIEQALRASFGRLLFQSWFDRMALSALGDWVFPASRLWASAELAGDDLDRFVALTPALQGVRLHRGVLGRSLVDLSRLRTRAAASEQCWADAFFAARTTQDALDRAEAARLRDGRLYLGARIGFVTLARRTHVHAVTWAIPTEAETIAALGQAVSSPRSIYTGSGVPAITESRRLRKRSHTEFILCFALPGGVGGALQARVFEPTGVANPPTVIHCHGFGMEPDHTNGTFDEFMPLVRAGIRLIRVTAPWHGSRRTLGTWSGESFLAGVPVGAIAMLGTAVRELSVLIEWSRATSKGKVGLSGVSMGALTAQLAAVHMAHWSAAQRADALFLVGTSDRLDRIAFESALTGALGLDAALRAKGWTAEGLRRFGSLTNADGEPAIPSDSIFVMLGTADDVTPFDGGVALARRWRVPAVNQFHRPQGHFSLSPSLISDNTPLLRFARYLQQRH